MARIYTRRGDDGTTGLIGGSRKTKDDLRVSAYGEVDELCSALGAARSALAAVRVGRGEGAGAQPLLDLDALLARLQGDLFGLGAELATPDEARAPVAPGLLSGEEVVALEQEIDRMEAELPPLRNFILPGGSPAGAMLHLCRAICRRAERAIVRLSKSERVRPEVLAWVNRLGDLLFVLARVANRRAGAAEEPWRAVARGRGG
jgi:cob(I)alamin adenosyltransferase